MPDFDKLQEHAEKLGDLLKKGNRETGRTTWTMFVGEHWKAIVDMWNNQGDDTGSITPERAKELEGAAVVYGVGFTGGQIGIAKGILMDVGPDCFNRKNTTALLIVDATAEDLPEYRRDFSTLLIIDWETMFEHVESAKAYAVGILKKRADAINEEMKKYS